MGDILSKLQMVSEKIGVTETAHTIEEQVDLISESLDKIPHSTNIAEALDDLSEVAQNINNEEVYVDKTITENGTYLPAEDEATAYSKVVVDVQNSINKIVTPVNIINNNRAGLLSIFFAENGIYNMRDNDYMYNNVLANPLKSTSLPGDSISSTDVIFTPASDFVGFIDGGSPWTNITGDIPTPGDGKWYRLHVDWSQSVNQRVVCTRLANTNTFEVSIT